MPQPTDIAQAGALLRKSHTGCLTCRQRKVKCDEVRPVCGKCNRRFIDLNECQYPDHVSRKPAMSRNPKRRTAAGIKPKSRATAAPPVASQRTIPLGPIAALTMWPASLQSSGPQRTMEMRLMHHYSTVVCHEMPNCGPNQVLRTMWDDKIPRVGFEHSIVLDPLLALTAMHLHSYTPSDIQLPTLVSFYLDRTLAKYRELVPRIDTNLAEPLYLTAVILTNITWLLSHHHDRNALGILKLPLQTYHMLRGIRTLFARKAEFLMELGYAFFEPQGRPPVPEVIVTTDLAERLGLIENDLTRLLKAFDMVSDLHREAYKEAADYIFWLYKAVLLGIVDGPILVLISTVPLQLQHGPFLELLTSHDPLAMALFARSLALIRLVKFKWWLRGAGEYDVFRNVVQSVLGLLPISYRWTVKWLHQVATEESSGGMWETLRASLLECDGAAGGLALDYQKSSDMDEID